MPISNQLSQLAERTSMLLFVYNLNQARFTFMNPSCLDFFRLENNDVSTAELLEMISNDDQEYVVSKYNALMEGKLQEDIEFRVQHGEHQRWLRISAYPESDTNENLIVGQGEDISTTKAYIDILNNHNIKKNSILTIISHDLAGPIGTVQNLSELLSRETATLNNPRIDQFVNMISKISKNNIHLIRNFLDQEFLESSGIRLIKKRIDLVTKLNIGTEEILNMQEELRIHFVFTANQKVIYAEIDEDKFMQVINNLITNSLKFTPEGGKIEIDVMDKNTEVLITIRDNGIGIPQHYHATLFDKFSPAGRSGLKGEISTGLGMSIIKTIVEWHKGNIWFESEEAKGTTFYIQLPK